MMTDAEVCEWFAREVMGWNYGTALEAWAREWWLDPRFWGPALEALRRMDWAVDDATSIRLPNLHRKANAERGDYLIVRHTLAAAVLAAIRVEDEESQRDG